MVLEQVPSPALAGGPGDTEARTSGEVRPRGPRAECAAFPVQRSILGSGHWRGADLRLLNPHILLKLLSQEERSPSPSSGQLPSLPVDRTRASPVQVIPRTTLLSSSSATGLGHALCTSTEVGQVSARSVPAHGPCSRRRLVSGGTEPTGRSHGGLSPSAGSWCLRQR